MTRKKLLDYFLNLDYILTGITFLILVSVTFVGVIMRYFVNNPFVWLEEIQLMCFLWIVFFGSGAAFRTGSHVSIEFIVDRLPEKTRKVVEILIYLVVIIVLSFYMVQGMRLINQLIGTQRATNIFKVPYSIIYAAFPIGCVLMIINHTLIVLASLFNSKEADRVGEV